MRPWRDIIGVNDWERVLSSADSTAHLSKIKSLQAKFDSRVDTPERSLQRLGERIATYHQISKTELGSLPRRIGHLAGIAEDAEKHLLKFHVDMDRAKQRVREKQSMVNGKSEWTMVPLHKHADTGSYMAGKDAEQSIDRTLLSLKNRGSRKAEYLSQLQRYYQGTNADPQTLLQQIRAPQKRDDGFIGLHPGVRMEQIDPWHRPVEVKFDEDDDQLIEASETPSEETISGAFAQWFNSLPRHKLPFFLWLEGHPICLDGDRERSHSVRSVRYVEGAEDRAAAAQRHRIRLVFRHGARLWMDDLQGARGYRVAHTDGYACASGKGVTDAAAYVWTGQEIIIAQHVEGGFHHSSFTGGGAVRCAGMIKIAGGLVTYVSNNSGHYMPDKDLLHTFVSKLQLHSLLAPGCEVQCQGGKATYRNLASHFLANWQSL